MVGSLEVDYDADVWADHDENCHGEIDTDENRESFPEGFVWDCCNKAGYRRGCSVGRHSKVGDRGRYGTQPGTGYVQDEKSSEDKKPQKEDQSENESEDENGESS